MNGEAPHSTCAWISRFGKQPLHGLGIGESFLPQHATCRLRRRREGKHLFPARLNRLDRCLHHAGFAAPRPAAQRRDPVAGIENKKGRLLDLPVIASLSRLGHSALDELLTRPAGLVILRLARAAAVRPSSSVRLHVAVPSEQEWTFAHLPCTTNYPRIPEGPHRLNDPEIQGSCP